MQLAFWFHRKILFVATKKQAKEIISKCFLHLKGNKLAIDNKADSLTLINVVSKRL